MRRGPIIVDEDGALELGRDCDLEEWFAALQDGLFAEEWERRRQAALADLEAMRVQEGGLDAADS